MSLPSLFFFLNIVSAMCRALAISYEFEDWFLRKAHEQFNGDCIESVGHLGEQCHFNSIKLPNL